MSPEQYGRWKDFAMRMARHAFDTATPERRLKIESSIVGFFRWYDHSSDEVERIVDWDNAPTYVGDAVDSHLQQHRHYRYIERTGEEIEHGNKFENQVSCCIRAGLDRASSPSGGVVGFTVGDLRRMYPEGLPDWVIEGYEPAITSETPDDVGVWL